MQPLPITTNFVSSNRDHGEVYSIQHYVIKFVSDLRQISGFHPVISVYATDKTVRHNIAEIFLKVASNAITQHQPKFVDLIYHIS